MKNKQRLVASILLAMRLTIVPVVLSIITITSLYAKEAKSQEVLQKTFSVSVKNKPLSILFREIQKQTGAKFSFSSNVINAERQVTYLADKKTIAEFLNVFLKPLNISYEIIDDRIILFSVATAPIHPKQVMLDEAVNKTITGKVTNDKGEPQVAITVTEKGKKNSVITDENGDFEITVLGESTVLVFSGAEFQNREIAVQDIGKNIVLTEKVKGLQDVVVIGYGTSKKKDLTGSVSSVNTKELKTLPVPSIGEALQGRATGVQVLASGEPGSNVTFRIRGTGTINNSDPLLVIDGVPADIPLNTLSPDDIANIEILKDASAAAIYGSRGANGVVIITTKRGLQGKNMLELKSFVGQQKATNVIPMLDASQFASLHNEMMLNNGQAQNPAYANPTALGKGTDWLGALFNTATIQNYSLAYSGGSPKTTYYVSGSMMDQKGIVLNTSYRRYTVQFNSESKVFDWLKFGNNLTLNHDIKKSGDYNIRNTMAALPGQKIYNDDGSYSGPVGQSSWYGDIRNPIGTATLTENSTKGYNALGNLYSEVSITKNLKFKTTGGIQAVFWDTRTWSPKYNWQPIPQPNSLLAEGSNKSITLLWDNYLTYNKIFKQKHNLTLLAGSSAQNNRYEFLSGSIQNFPSNSTQQINTGTAQPTINGNESEWALLSFIGRVNYGYDNKYLFTATIRRDGSSRFGDKNKWGWFPSVSAAWRLSEESYFKTVRWISDLKVRAGYGITGNQNIGNYSFASVLQTVQYNFNGTTVNAVVPLQIPNTSVRWEAVEQANLGVDAALFNDRVKITADVYLKNTNDMLVPMSVPISTGYSDIVVPSINAGKVQNRGFELNITTVNTKSKRGVEWVTSFNFSYNKNKVVSLNDSVPIYTGSIGLNQNLAIQKAGYPVGAFYGFITNGIFQSDAEVAKYATQVPGNDAYNRTSAGDIKFKDLNNDGKIDDADRTYIGNPNPRFIFAMNNTFSYKGVELSIFLQGVQGNDIFNANRIYQEGMSVAQNQTTEVLNRWRPDFTSTDIPRAVFNDPNKNTRVSDRFIEDGSYLKIKNITLAYSLPQKVIGKIKLQTARIYLSAQNVHTFTKYKGFDPEVGVNGIDLNVYPVTRTISAGINLIF